jgi:hypothetical protein
MAASLLLMEADGVASVNVTVMAKNTLNNTICHLSFPWSNDKFTCDGSAFGFQDFMGVKIFV